MSKYKPAEQIDTAADQLNRTLKRADDEARRQLTIWMQMVDVFWCAPVTHGENAQTKEQIQAKIDADPVKTQLILTGSKNFIAFSFARGRRFSQRNGTGALFVRWRLHLGQRFNAQRTSS